MNARTYIAIVGIAFAACRTQAQLLDDWVVSGSNTARAESYRVRGDPLSGPYRFDGPQYYDEFSLNLARSLTPYDSIRAQLYGVANDSDYRSPDHGVVPERINVTREKGDAAIPYRAEAGDVFGYFSYRTLQRSLKGAQVELQPTTADGGVRQSIVIVSGVDQASWRHLHGEQSWTSGLSWLFETEPQAHFAANVLHTRREADVQRGLPDRNQTVASAVADYGWQWATQRLRFEGELASLRGDHDGYADAHGVVDPATGQDRRGTGAFAQVSGAGVASPFDYRVRFERYDRDYRPAETAIIPDHRSSEAFAGWRFANGLGLRGRAQEFVDAMQSGNDLRTRTYGATLAGPFGAGFGGSVDVFHQDLLKQDATIDRGVWNANANVSRPLPEQWIGTAALFWQQVDDRTAAAADARTAQLQLGASHALSMAGWYGSFTPGISVRRVTGVGAVKDVSPTLALSLARGVHVFGLSYGYQKLRPDESSLATVDVNQLRVDYRFIRGRDTLGVEASAYDRRVTIGQDNETYRLSLFWTHAFDTSARALAASASPASMGDTGMLPRDIGVLVAVAPGADFDATVGRLADAGYQGGMPQGNVLVYEARLLPDIERRQRLVLVRDAGRVARMAAIVSVDDPNDSASVAQAYERARKALLDRYGAPALTLEEGSIGPSLVADLNAGRLVRIAEWRTPSGRLRLGIPRRLDGLVRIEIQHAATFGDPRAPWSIEAVR